MCKECQRADALLFGALALGDSLGIGPWSLVIQERPSGQG